jgi:hypothetical protein
MTNHPLPHPIGDPCEANGGSSRVPLALSWRRRRPSGQAISNEGIEASLRSGILLETRRRWPAGSLSPEELLYDVQRLVR